MASDDKTVETCVHLFKAYVRAEICYVVVQNCTFKCFVFNFLFNISGDVCFSHERAFSH